MRGPEGPRGAQRGPEGPRGGPPRGPVGPRGAPRGRGRGREGAGGAQRGFLPELRPGISKTFPGVSGSFPGRFRVVFPNLENGFGPFPNLFRFLPPRSLWAPPAPSRPLPRPLWAPLGPSCPLRPLRLREGGAGGGRTRVQEAGVGEGRTGVKGGGGVREGGVIFSVCH